METTLSVNLSSSDSSDSLDSSGSSSSKSKSHRKKTSTSETTGLLLATRTAHSKVPRWELIADILDANGQENEKIQDNNEKKSETIKHNKDEREKEDKKQGKKLRKKMKKEKQGSKLNKKHISVELETNTETPLSGTMSVKELLKQIYLQQYPKYRSCSLLQHDAESLTNLLCKKYMITELEHIRLIEKDFWTKFHDLNPVVISTLWRLAFFGVTKEQVSQLRKQSVINVVNAMSKPMESVDSTGKKEKTTVENEGTDHSDNEQEKKSNGHISRNGRDLDTIRVIGATGKEYIVSRWCPHQMADLRKGKVVTDINTGEDLLQCPKHKWRFALSRGGVHVRSNGKIDNSCSVDCHEVENKLKFVW